jgi:Ca2+-binding EF-hand superfamily protein
MKRMTLSLLLAATVMLPALAFAHGDGDAPCAGNRAGRMQRWQEKKQQILEQFDADKDGKLDEAERANARRAHLSRRFERMDADKDGAISYAEFEAAAQKRHERFRRHMMDRK